MAQADYYKLVGSGDPTTDWTTNVVLERDDDGNVVKSVSAARPEQLSKEDVDKIESLGLKVEKVSKKEAEDAQRAAVATASDVAGTAPLLGSNDNQSDDESGDDE